MINDLIHESLCSAQVDKNQLAQDINMADDGKTEQLKAFIWKRKSDVFIEGVLKLITLRIQF